MPFTPFHLGPSSWIGLHFLKIFDFPALLLGSVIIDLEPFFVILFHPGGYPLHGFFHSFLGGSVLAVLAAVFLYILRNKIKRIMAIFGLAQDSSFKKILWSSLVGAYSHVLLDSFLYKDIRPFLPLEINPFSNLFSLSQIYLFCSLSFLVAVLVYFFKIRSRSAN